MANTAYTWEQYWYAVNDYLLARNMPTLTKDDVRILGVCYDHCYREHAAFVAVREDRIYRNKG